jgi:hypothetical protein
MFTAKNQSDSGIAFVLSLVNTVHSGNLAAKRCHFQFHDADTIEPVRVTSGTLWVRYND